MAGYRGTTEGLTDTEQAVIRILLIEDDDEDAYLVRSMLAQPKWGRYDFTRAACLSEALADVSRNAFEVALLDLHLSDSDGLATLSAFVASAPAVPVVVMTGLDDQEIAIAALSGGAQDYLVKGQADTEVLERCIRYAMERKRNREELEDSHELLQALIDGVPELLFLMQPDGTILIANRAARAFLAAGEALEGQNAYALFPEDVSAFRKHYVEEAIRQAAPFRFEGCLGERRFAYCVNAIPAVPGLPARVMVFAMDITARHQAQEQRQRLEAKIQHAQKLESLGVLAGGIAHDFNNLLTGILANADLLLEDLPRNSDVRQAARGISEGATQAAELTRLMLAYSGRATFEIQPVDVSRLVREMANLLGIAISKHVTLQFHLAEASPVIDADPSQVRQILMNLVTNASDAIGEKHGVIQIRTGIVRATESYFAEIGLMEPINEGNYAILVVTDDGIGMERQTMQRIFDPFFTTKFAGRGLGLSAMRGIVTAHGGGIAVKSQRGCGSTFTVLFPLSENAAPALAAPTDDYRSWRGAGRVLVVDDETGVRHVARTILERFGFSVVEAENGRQGVDLVQMHEDIVAVLLDLTMPVMSGLEAFREIRQLNERVPIILTSGYAEEDARSRLEEPDGRFSAFIQKPYQVSKLITTLRDLIEA